MKAHYSYSVAKKNPKKKVKFGRSDTLNTNKPEAANLNNIPYFVLGNVVFTASLRTATGKTLAVVEMLLKENNEKNNDRDTDYS